MLAGFLFLTNIILLTLWLRDDDRPRRQPDRDSKSGHSRFSAFLKNEVKFSDEQIQEYDTMRQAYWRMAKPMLTELNENKMAMFNKVTDDSVTMNQVDSMATALGRKQAELDKAFFNHFREIRSKCNASQRPAFDSSFPSMVNKMFSRGKK